MNYCVILVGITYSIVCICMEKPPHVSDPAVKMQECMGLYHLALLADERYKADPEMAVEAVEQAYVSALKCFIQAKSKSDPQLLEKQKKLKEGLTKIITLHKIENPNFQVPVEISKLLHRASLLFHLQEYDQTVQKDRPLGSFSSHYFKTKQNLNEMLELSHLVIKNTRLDAYQAAATAYFKGMYHHIQALKLELDQPNSYELIEQVYIVAFNSMLSALEQGDENAREELEFIFERIQELRQKIYQQNSTGYVIPAEYTHVCNAMKLVREKNPI